MKRIRIENRKAGLKNRVDIIKHLAKRVASEVSQVKLNFHWQKGDLLHIAWLA